MSAQRFEVDGRKVSITAAPCRNGVWLEGVHVGYVNVIERTRGGAPIWGAFDLEGDRVGSWGGYAVKRRAAQVLVEQHLAESSA